MLDFDFRLQTYVCSFEEKRLLPFIVCDSYNTITGGPQETAYNMITIGLQEI